MRLFITLLLSLHIFIVFAWQHPDILDNDQFTNEYSNPNFLHTISQKRGPAELQNHVVNITEDCMKVSVQTGHYYFRASLASDRVCGLYLLSEPDYKIEIVVTYLDAPCANKSIIEVIDGWELNGEYFPSNRDHKKSMDERVTDSCGTKSVKKIFVSSQNAALIEYRLTQKGHSFAVMVNHIQNHKPCNVLVYGSEGEYTLRNFGRRINCSLTAVQPSTFRILGMDVGNTVWPLLRTFNVLLFTENCIKRGMMDYVEIGGSKGLDNTEMITSNTLCGLGSDNKEYAIMCEVSTIRLVSSGMFNNILNLDVKAILDIPAYETSLTCPV